MSSSAPTVAQPAARDRAAIVRVGVPEPGGRLVDVARAAGLPVLFSANAFMLRDTEGRVVRIRRPDLARFGKLDAALDSAGYVAACLYAGYPWSVEQYLDLVSAYPWTWFSTMDYCCEPEIADDDDAVAFRMAETCRLFAVLSRAAEERGLAAPVPVLQGWRPEQYAWCADHYPLVEWPALVGIGSVCRRPLGGPDGVIAILEALDRILPAHTRFHLYGLKGTALSVVGQHPRLASVDSMAWDYAARRDFPTGRTAEIRAQYMLQWAAKNQAAARGFQRSFTGSLLPVDPICPHPALDEWLALVLDNEIEAADAYHHYQRLGGSAAVQSQVALLDD